MSSTFESRYGVRPLEQETPSPTVTPTATTTESVIDRHSQFDGLYVTTHDLRIEGTAAGEIQCEGTVTVAEEARLTAKVQARNVVIAGSADGEITCSERFTLRPSGEMRGSVRAASLAVEEGAFFEGEFRMADETAASTPPDAQVEEQSINVTAAMENEEQAEDTLEDEELPEPVPMPATDLVSETSDSLEDEDVM
ncbi:MAG: bactofilin family protein [Ardenticatenaceae bacterium]